MIGIEREKKKKKATSFDVRDVRAYSYCCGATTIEIRNVLARKLISEKKLFSSGALLK